MIAPVALLDQPLTEVVDTGGFLDLSRFLEVGVEYDHLTLKRIFWAVGDLGLNAQKGDETFRIGGRFFDAIYTWWENGFILMSDAVLDDGTPTDFWTAVFMSKHPDNKHFKLVPGCLKLIDVPESYLEVLPL